MSKKILLGVTFVLVVLLVFFADFAKGGYVVEDAARGQECSYWRVGVAETASPNSLHFRYCWGTWMLLDREINFRIIGHTNMPDAIKSLDCLKLRYSAEWENSLISQYWLICPEWFESGNWYVNIKTAIYPVFHNLRN